LKIINIYYKNKEQDACIYDYNTNEYLDNIPEELINSLQAMLDLDIRYLVFDDNSFIKIESIDEDLDDQCIKIFITRGIVD